MSGSPKPELAPPAHPVERLPREWEEAVARLGDPRFRGRQLFDWIHVKGVLDPQRMTNIPRLMRDRLAEDGLSAPLEVTRVARSDDGTRKLLVRTAAGPEVETVLIPQLVKADPDVDDEDREGDLKSGLVPGDVVTQCISTQVGCAMGCVFCASGVAGLKAHLSAAEIVTQVLLARQQLEGNERIQNVVLMGMGEPLHNYDAVARALALLIHPQGLAMSPRRVTLSTSGLVPGIDRLARDFGGQIQLAVSLHAADDELRSELMPINRKHPLAELVAALRRYPLPRRRRITIEYTLIRGVNDDLRSADRLVKLLHGIPVKVNLIPMNPISGSPYGAPDEARVHEFQERLCAKKLSTFVRRQRGDDIDAACGQLALHGARPRSKARILPVAH